MAHDAGFGDSEVDAFMGGGVAPQAANNFAPIPPGATPAGNSPSALPAQQAAQQSAPSQQNQGGFDGMFDMPGTQASTPVTSSEAQPGQHGYPATQDPSQGQGSPLGTPAPGTGEGGHPGGEEFIDDYDYRKDPLDVRNYIPEEQLEDEFPFRLSDVSAYKDFDSLKTGVAEKDRYIERLKTEREDLSTRVETQAGEIAALKSELSKAHSMITNGKSDEDVEAIMARQLLPEELQSVDPSTFRVNASDFVPTWDDFWTSFQKSNPVSRHDFDTDSEYRQAVHQMEDDARSKFHAKVARGERDYRKKLQEVNDQRFEYERALSDAKSRVRVQRDSDAERAARNQRETMRRLEEAVESMKTSVTPQSLGLLNSEDENIVGEFLRRPVSVFEGGEEKERRLSDVMVLVRAYYGKEAAELMLDGIKSRYAPNRNTASDSHREPVIQPQRPSRLSGPGRRRMGARPVNDISAQELMTSEGFLAPGARV